MSDQQPSGTPRATEDVKVPREADVKGQPTTEADRPGGPAPVTGQRAKGAAARQESK